jgi:hypothetical protein
MRKVPALFAASALLGAALLASTSPAQALDDPVDIHVEHDLDDSGSGPRVLEANGVTAGPGPELTIADEIDNPSNWGGNVLVDIDPDAETITVEVEESNCYDSVIVEITTDEIGSVTTISDALFAPEDEEDGPVTLATSVVGGVVTLAWSSDEDDCPSLGDVGAQAVFSYGPAEPSASLAPAAVQQGDPVTVEGTLCPDSPVEIVVAAEGGGDPVLETEVTGDATGDWTYEVDTTDLAPGAYTVASSCVLPQGLGFDYDGLVFEVSAVPVAPPAEPAPVAPDFTG